MFYTIGLLLELGIGGVTVARFLPGALFVLAVGMLYFVAREILGDRWSAGFATVVLAASPAFFTWHISAGGMVRSAALLFVLAGCYTGLQLFKTGAQIWLVPSAVLFGVTVLTHPVYAALFGLNFLYFYVYYSRSIRGLLCGVAVAVGGGILAAPWWMTIVVTYGPEIFLRTAGTQGGISPFTGPIGFLLTPSLPTMFTDVWHALAIVGGVYLILRQEFFLPFWLVTVLPLVTPHSTTGFATVIGVFMAVRLINDTLLPSLKQATNSVELPAVFDAAPERVVSLAAVCLLVTYAIVTGSFYAAGNPNLYREGSDDPLPMFFSGEDREAMHWIRQQTTTEATFVTLGDVGEWLPYFTERTVLVSTRGTEWEGAEVWRQQNRINSRLMQCFSAQCVNNLLNDYNLDPTYLYIPKTVPPNSVFERSNKGWNIFTESLQRSEDYRVVFENEGVLILRAMDSESTRAGG
jgi:hypothetical protein